MLFGIGADEPRLRHLEGAAMGISRRTAIGRMGAVGSVFLLLPRRALAELSATPSAVLGPFYPLTKPAEQDADLSLLKGHKRAIGQLIEVSGRVLDVNGNAVSGARIEIWQANAAGRYSHPADDNPAPLDPNFQGYGLLRADRLGRYRFVSIKPGGYPAGDDPPRPPHIHVEIQSTRQRRITQMLFPNEPLNDTDAAIPADVRPPLIAQDIGTGGDGAHRYVWDVILNLA